MRTLAAFLILASNAIAGSYSISISIAIAEAEASAQAAIPPNVAAKVSKTKLIIYTGKNCSHCERAKKFIYKNEYVGKHFEVIEKSPLPWMRSIPQFQVAGKPEFLTGYGKPEPLLRWLKVQHNERSKR